MINVEVKENTIVSNTIVGFIKDVRPILQISDFEIELMLIQPSAYREYFIGLLDIANGIFDVSDKDEHLLVAMEIEELIYEI